MVNPVKQTSLDVILRCRELAAALIPVLPGRARVHLADQPVGSQKGIPMKKIAIAAGAALVLGLGGVGAAGAFASTAPAAPASTSVSPTTPVSSTPTTESPATESSSPAEAPNAESTAPSTESTTPSDGNDGGHADPAGVDVNHVGGSNEK